MHNNTWELVPTQRDEKIIGNKYVFRMNLKVDKSLKRYKSRLWSRDMIKLKALVTQRHLVLWLNLPQ